jgi:hypothetical protein
MKQVPVVMVPDARVLSSMKNEQKYPWLYDSVAHQGYLSKFCELFCGPGVRSLIIEKLARKLCELGKDGESNTFISLDVQ